MQFESDSLVPRSEGARVFRRTRAEHDRTFQWGIGNRFRMVSANRYMPTSAPHPQEATVRDDYYDSDNPNVVWEELNEAWEVYWYENHKLNARPFKVKKFGIERAKVTAFQFYEELKANGRLGEKPRIAPAQDGVFYDQRTMSWVSLFWRGGRPHSRCYSATKYGFEGARTLAVAKQNDPVNGLLPVRGGGGTPVQFKRPPDGGNFYPPSGFKNTPRLKP